MASLGAKMQQASGEADGDFGEGDPLLGGQAVAEKQGLSTFFGVFVPCVLSIFSVILFLRMGYVVGQAGLLGTLGMLVLAYGIVLLTVFSISAISTNGVIRGGGAYYMISRSLGPEFGGSIGIMFYFANVVACGLYVMGFVEALVENFGPPEGPLPVGRWMSFAYCSALLFFCLIVCLIGAGAFAKASFFIFVVVISSVVVVIVSFFVKPAFTEPLPDNNQMHIGLANHSNLTYTGFNSTTLKGNLWPKYSFDYTTGAAQSFQTVFAVLFNGCTGIMAGANMSGDLKNASRSIPFGTLAACGTTFLVYIVIFTLSSWTTTRGMLVNDFGYLTRTNVWGYDVTIGTFAATLSAALSTLIGSSRILQAIACDGLLGNALCAFFNKNKKEPIRSVIISWFLVQMVLFVGKVNTIAPIVSMLFLLSYGVVNLACFALRAQSSPNFRPTWKFFSWHTGLLGALGCLGIMFMLQPLQAGLSVLVMLVLFVSIHFQTSHAGWGDVTQALIYHQVRKYLLRLGTESHVKFWRPQVLLLVDNPHKCVNAVSFANDLKKGGLFVLGRILTAEFDRTSVQQHHRELEAWQTLVRLEKWKAFVDVVIAPSVRQGARSLLTSCGLGGMRPNIVLCGFHGEQHPVDQLTNSLAETGRSSSRALRMFSKSSEVSLEAVSSQFDHTFDDPVGDGISQTDYVGMLLDSLEMGKHVGVHRNFDELPALLRQAAASKDKWYIDVWPVKDHTSDTYHYSYELLLQMATILHMTKRWRQLKVRIVELVDLEQHEEAERTRVQTFLEDIRITDAEIKILHVRSSRARSVSGLGDNPRHELPSLNSDVPYEGSGQDRRREQTVMSQSFDTASMNRQHSFVNQLIRENSQQTAVVLTYLPPPPVDPSGHGQYLTDIRALSERLPPTIMMRGVEGVITSNDVAV